MTAAEIKQRFPIESELSRRGIDVTRRGKELVALCPFHADKHPSLRIDPDKKLWTCDPCGVGGTVIDMVMRLDNITASEAMRRLSGQSDSTPNGKELSKPVCSYDYHDALGRLVYQVCRYEPKTFRQRRPDGKAGWLWSMEGIERVLYRFPQVLKAQTVWIVEGEKDADNLTELGFVATTNAGGAGKWCDAYSDALKGKHVILCGDNDKPGKAHVQKVAESLAGKAKSLRAVTVPDPHKDISDYLATFPDNSEAVAKVNALANQATPLAGGIVLPIESMAELETAYVDHVTRCQAVTLDLGRWLPSLGRSCRGLVPGEFAVVLADTGVGKTAILHNIALHAGPLQTLVFELELPGTLTFERFIALANGVKAREVFEVYRDGGHVDFRKGARLEHVHVCSKSQLTVFELESIIRKSELKIGGPPALVLLDYLQLMGGKGMSRYERASDIAEGLKVVAKSTNTIIIAASQIHRREDETPEIYLHDAKDSGAIENSAGLVLGAWRDPQDAAVLILKVLKNTKGRPGVKVTCDFDGETYRISEQSPIDKADLPPRLPYSE